MKYWLMKTEPGVFSYDDLLSRPRKTEGWDGVRNYQARNLMRDQFRKGDQVFIYHSSCEEPAVIGIAEVVKEAYADSTALDPKSPYYDEQSDKQGKSRWVKVDVQARRRLGKPVTLRQIRSNPKLKNMRLVQKGSRLSVQPVTLDEWNVIIALGSGS